MEPLKTSVTNQAIFEILCAIVSYTDTDIDICGDILSSDIDDSNEEVKVPNDEG